MNHEELLKALEYIDNFIENIECGSSYWIAPNGETFYTDVGCGYDFWKQVYDYLKRNGIENK